MAIKKGAQKMGGRTKGTPNKVTKEVRDMIKDFVEQSFDDVIASYNRLDPRDKCEVWVKMLPYVAPKLANVELNANLNKKSFSEELKALREEE